MPNRARRLRPADGRGSLSAIHARNAMNSPAPTTKHKAFPLSFVTTGKHLLLVGGGSLGESRLATAVLFDWDRITFVAVDPTPDTRAVAGSDARVTLHERPVRESDIEDVDLVIESTMDKALGRELAGWCRPRRIPLNAMDKLESCDVYYPALILRGPLVLAIASSGETPALAATLRRVLEERMGPGWCNAALLMAETRRSLPQNTARMELLKRIASDERLLDLIARNDIQGMRNLIKDATRRMPN